MTEQLPEAWAEYQDTKDKAYVLRQLIALGYELTRSTFYRHCDKGQCRANDDGVYSRRMVKAEYCEAVPIQREGDRGGSGGQGAAFSIEKQKLENEKLRLHNRREDLKVKKEEGLVFEKAAFYLEMAARTVILDNSFIQKIDLEGPAIIAAVGGDVSRMPEFMDMMTTIWNELLNSFSTTDEFEVLFEEDDDEYNNSANSGADNT